MNTHIERFWPGFNPYTLPDIGAVVILDNPKFPDESGLTATVTKHCGLGRVRVKLANGREFTTEVKFTRKIRA